MSKIQAIAQGYFSTKGTIDLVQSGKFLGDCVDILRRGEKLSDLYIGALECIGGQLLGEAMLTHAMLSKAKGSL